MLIPVNFSRIKPIFWPSQEATRQHETPKRSAWRVEHVECLPDGATLFEGLMEQSDEE